MHERHLRKILDDQIELAGSQKAWCETHGVPQSVISTYLNSRRTFPPQVALALGFVAVTEYVPIRPVAGGNRMHEEMHHDVR